MNHLFELQKKYSLVARNSTVRQRVQLLKKLELVIWAERERIAEALHKDFGKSLYESHLTEIYPAILEIRHCLKHLYSWTQPRRVPRTPLLLSASSEIHYESKGVCLIIAPWNYPFNLSITPLISAIAAGNTVIIKPSELTPHTSSCLNHIISQVFEPQWVAVTEGGIPETQSLLKLPFDHIFFTGSSQVGKLIMEAAAKNLTPVTLELGGKSPTIISSDADIDWAASKVAWGKFLNAGQTCVAPDYVLVHQSQYIPFIEAVERYLSRFFQNKDVPVSSNTKFDYKVDQGATEGNAETFAQQSAQDDRPSINGIRSNRIGYKDYCRIISRRHLERLMNLISEAVARGVQIRLPVGDSKEVNQVPAEGNTFLPPTLVLNPPLDIALMQEEIFGPILPIIPFGDLEEALGIVQKYPKPLALYIFSKDNHFIKRVQSQISAGGVCINDLMVHLSHTDLPFGGIGNSGMGNYHGEFGFQTFSHTKAVLRQSAFSRWMKIIYPPYSNFKYQLLKFLMRLV